MAHEDVVAAELVAARTEGRSLTTFPGGVPASMAEAYVIQDRAISLWPDSLGRLEDRLHPGGRRWGGEPDRLVGNTNGLVLGSVLAEGPRGAPDQLSC